MFCASAEKHAIVRAARTSFISAIARFVECACRLLERSCVFAFISHVGVSRSSPQRHSRALDTELGNGYSMEKPARRASEGCAVTQPAYPAARAAALRVHSRYDQHPTRRRVENEGVIGPLPDVETIEAIID